MKQRLLGMYVGVDRRRAIEGSFLEPNPFEDGVARVSDAAGRAYLIDNRGAPLFAERYDTIGAFHSGIANTQLGDRWGLVRRDGRILAAPAYETLFLPAEDRITYVLDGNCGFLDMEGNLAVAAKWSAAGWLSEGLCPFLANGKYGYVDREGNVVIAPAFDEAGPFSKGRARVKIDEGWGVIDRAGALVHAATYSQIGELVNGACWAVGDETVIVLGVDTQLGGRAFDEVKQAGDNGVWPVRVDEKWGYLTADGTLGKLDFEQAWPFWEGLAPVQKKGKQGFARPDGTLAIPCRYDDVWKFTKDQRAAVRRGEYWTFVDPMGTEHGKADLLAPSHFTHGVAAVRTKSGLGLQRLDGQRTALLGAAWVGEFADGVAPVIVPDRGVIDGVAMQVPSAPHVRPEGGLDYALFDGMGADDHVIAIVSFARELAHEERVLLDKRIKSWERCMDPAGDLYTEDKYVSSTSVYMRVQNLDDPKAALVLLLDQIADLPLQELLFSRWGTPPDTEVMQPRNNPAMRGVNLRVTFDDWDDYWDCVWNPKGPRPVSENYFYLRGGLFGETGELECIEERHMPIFYKDVDVCLGALNTQCEYFPPDERAKEVQASLAASLAARFAIAGAIVPTAKGRGNVLGLERITYRGRSGYSFAFPYGELTHRFSSGRVRFREPELMDALRDVVKEKALAPVILWHRYSHSIPMLPIGSPHVLVVNLFEPGGGDAPAKPVAKKAPKTPPAPPPKTKPATAKKPLAKKKPAPKPVAKKKATPKLVAKKLAPKKKKR
ncbi:MAG: WG repeat-containing protein [Kofleriaceae bacterium]